MWNNMINLFKDEVNMDTAEKGWDKVQEMKGKYVFILEEAMNEYYNQRKPCITMKVGHLINNLGYGIATRKGLEIK